MKRKCKLLCTLIAAALLLGGCGKSTDASASANSGISAPAQNNEAVQSAPESGETSEAAPVPAKDDEVIVWSDPIVEQLFRRAFDREEGDIWRSEMETVTKFDLAPNSTEQNNFQITINDYVESIHVGGFSLEDLKYCVNVTEIRVSGLQIDSIDFLSDMSNLKRVVLPSNQLTDIAPLRGKLQLEFLWLERNNISDLSPISGLENLKTLSVTGNQITDITPLAGLKQLEELTLSYNEIEDYTPLYGLQKLKTLYTSGGNLTSEEKDELQSNLPFCNVR